MRGVLNDHHLVSWPNGYGIGPRSRGLQVRVLPRSSCSCAGDTSPEDFASPHTVTRVWHDVQPPEILPSRVCRLKCGSSQAELRTPSGARRLLVPHLLDPGCNMLLAIPMCWQECISPESHPGHTDGNDGCIRPLGH